MEEEVGGDHVLLGRRRELIDDAVVSVSAEDPLEKRLCAEVGDEIGILLEILLPARQLGDELVFLVKPPIAPCRMGDAAVASSPPAAMPPPIRNFLLDMSISFSFAVKFANAFSD